MQVSLNEITQTQRGGYVTEFELTNVALWSLSYFKANTMADNVINLWLHTRVTILYMVQDFPIWAAY